MRERSDRMKLWQSFSDAGKGIGSVFRTERNFRIHIAMLIFSVVLGLVVGLSGVEWIGLMLCAAMVLVTEAFNTALEYLADAVHPEVDPGVGRAKDASAGAVLIASFAAAVVGAILFLPKIWEMLT